MGSFDRSTWALVIATVVGVACGGSPAAPPSPAALRCAGDGITHGLVVVGRASVASTFCTNVGDVDADLVVSTRGDGFRALQDRLRLEAGDTAEISVELVPRRAGAHEGELVLDARGDAEPLATLELSGTGVELSDCVASLAPPTLTLTSAAPVREPVSLRNRGSTACLLEAVETRSTRGQVRVMGPPLPRWIPPMTELELFVDVTPAATGVEATVELTIQHTLGDRLELAVSTDR